MKSKYLSFIVYPATFLVVLFSCTKPPDTKSKAEKINKETYLKKIAANDSLITVTTDAGVLVQLYSQKLVWTAAINDLQNWTKTQLALYEIKSEGDENYAKGIEHLNAVIAKEKELALIDSLQPLLAKAFGYRYYIYEERDINHKVIADCEKYLQYSSMDLDKEYKSFILNASGIAYCKIGDHQESVNKLEQLLQMTDAEQDAVAKGRTYVNLSNAYYNLGNTEKAKEVAEKGLLIQELIVTHRAFLYAILANTAIKDKNYTLAADAINTAITLLKNTGENESLADIYSIQGDLNTALKNKLALKSYQTALAYRQKNTTGAKGRAVAKLYIKIGGIALENNNTAEAILQNNKALEALFEHIIKKHAAALPEDKELYHENAAMDALDANANALLIQSEKTNNTDDLTDALLCINKAFDIETMLRQQYIYDKSKYAGSDASKNRSAVAILICNKLFTSTKLQEWAEKALHYAEKSKANVLSDKVRENILLNQNDTTVQHAKTLRLLLEEVTLQLKMQEKKPSANPEEIALLKQDKISLEKEFAIYQNLINTSLSEKTKKLTDKESIALLQKNLLTEHNSLVEYFIADSLLYIFKADRTNGVQIRTTNYTKVKKLLLALLPYFKQPEQYNNNPGTYDSIAKQLNLALLAPFLTSDKKQELLIIPDGELYSLPFESLKNEQNQYLIYTVNIVYGFSCASLMEQAQIKTIAAENTIAIFAPFIEYNRNQLASLEHSVNEVTAVSAFNKKAGLYSNKNANLQTFINNAGKNSVLHLATHAIAEENDSATTRIEFADSSLYLNKVYGLRINNDLVVLSACETGVGILQQSEGNLSLARAFYYAGAKNVINSLWKVNDKSTGQIFKTFYANLKQKVSVGEALYKAKLHYLKTAAIEEVSPYYWSSFICIGTGNTQLKGSTDYIWYIVTAGTVVLFLLWLVLKKRFSKK